jgi:hypothetical protein
MHNLNAALKPPKAKDKPHLKPLKYSRDGTPGALCKINGKRSKPTAMRILVPFLNTVWRRNHRVDILP